MYFSKSIVPQPQSRQAFIKACSIQFFKMYFSNVFFKMYSSKCVSQNVSIKMFFLNVFLKMYSASTSIPSSIYQSMQHPLLLCDDKTSLSFHLKEYFHNFDTFLPCFLKKLKLHRIIRHLSNHAAVNLA